MFTRFHAAYLRFWDEYWWAYLIGVAVLALVLAYLPRKRI